VSKVSARRVSLKPPSVQARCERSNEPRIQMNCSDIVLYSWDRLSYAVILAVSDC